MTIAISLKINDGVVLAADSATTIANPMGVPIKVYNSGDKVFQITSMPIGVLTWGLGGIGRSSTSKIVRDFDLQLEFQKGEPQTVKEVAERLKRFVYDDRYVSAFKAVPVGKKPAMGFIVAGYSQGAKLAEEFQVLIDVNGKCEITPVRKQDETGVAWRGLTELLSRLIMGFSEQAPEVLKQALGLTDAQKDTAAQAMSQKLGFFLAMDQMPFKDAVDLVDFYVSTAIQISRFLPLQPVVAGPVDIAVISEHDGFKWVRKKQLYPREFNAP